jgi:Stage III sporulation protein D.
MIQILNYDRRERCEILADYLIEHKATVRDTAQKYGISKSTVHKDITEKLKSVNKSLYEDAQEVLNFNKSERHIRGGEATKLKYMNRAEIKAVNQRTKKGGTSNQAAQD